jgi:hypothetical protein
MQITGNNVTTLAKGDITGMPPHGRIIFPPLADEAGLKDVLSKQVQFSQHTSAIRFMAAASLRTHGQVKTGHANPTLPRLYPDRPGTGASTMNKTNNPLQRPVLSKTDPFDRVC